MDDVLRRYGAATRSLHWRSSPATPGGCCPDKSTGASFGSALYDATSAASSPTRRCSRRSAAATPPRSPSCARARRVLDLGSGGGIDVLLSARRVGPTGFAYGVDMTDEMLELARRNAAEAGATNVEFLKGTSRRSRCRTARSTSSSRTASINLSPDKPAVLAEMPGAAAGGRVGISDVVAEDQLTPEQRAERGSLRRLHRRRTVARASTTAGSRRRGSSDVERRPSRTRSPTACTPQSSRRRSPKRRAVRAARYLCGMPHWVELLAIVVAAWLALAVVGGWLIGLGLGAIERHQEVDET